MLHVSVLQSLHTPCCNFGTNHVVNGSFYRDVNIKLKDHYLFCLHRDIRQKDFFLFFGGAANAQSHCCNSHIIHVVNGHLQPPL
jgi:hypothetical protein